MEKRILAFDFGASSGRAMLSRFEGNQLKAEEIHRFSNDPVVLNGVLYWDIVRMMFEIKRSISLALAKGGFDAIGIDTWAVDFVLLDADNKRIGDAVAYRDERTEGIREALEKEWDRRHPGRAGPTAERDTFVRRSMRGFSKTLRARLVGLVLVLPLVVIVTIIVFVNYN